MKKDGRPAILKIGLSRKENPISPRGARSKVRDKLNRN